MAFPDSSSVLDKFQSARVASSLSQQRDATVRTHIANWQRWGPAHLAQLTSASPFCLDQRACAATSAPEDFQYPLSFEGPLVTRFSPLDFSLLSPDFRGLVLLNCT